MLTTAPTRCCCQCQILTLIHPNCQGRDIHYISRTSYARFRDRMKKKLIFLAISLAFLLNIRVEVMVTLHGESTSHRWWNLPLDNHIGHLTLISRLSHASLTYPVPIPRLSRAYPALISCLSHTYPARLSRLLMPSVYRSFRR